MMRHVAFSLVALSLAGCATQGHQGAAPALSKDALATQVGEKPTPTSPPTGQQWLYGSAEGSVASTQVYKAMAQYVRAKALNRAIKSQAVLSEGSTPDAPRFDSCGSKPLAAVFDADETLIWNVGAMRYMAEKGKDFDPAIWNEWEKSGAWLIFVESIILDCSIFIFSVCSYPTCYFKKATSLISVTYIFLKSFSRLAISSSISFRASLLASAILCSKVARSLLRS